MTVIKPVFRKCPNCSTLIKGFEYLSSNSFGAKLYSDTYTAASMDIPDGSDYVGCPKCEYVFNTENCETFSKEVNLIERRFDKTDEVDASEPLSHFKTTKLLLQSNERRTHLLWYLWAFNHEITKKERKKEIKTGDYKKYTDELMSILQSETENPDSAILSIEITRERGEFSEAAKQFENIDIDSLPKHLKKIAIELKKHIDKKESSVYELKYDDIWAD